MANLQGKVIAVTGAASGIARATAFVIAERGGTLALADLNQDGLETVAAEISKLHQGIAISTKVVNVSKSDEVDAWLDEVVKQFGKLDGALNAAAIIGPGFAEASVEKLTNEQWDAVMDVNLRGTFYCLRAELQRMPEGNASIVNMASVAGMHGVRWGAPYCTSKVSIRSLRTIFYDGLMKYSMESSVSPNLLRRRSVAAIFVLTRSHRKFSSFEV